MKEIYKWILYGIITILFFIIFFILIAFYGGYENFVR